MRRFFFFESYKAAETFKRESAKGRTSKASAIEHTLKVMSEYGDAIRNRIKKINASNIDTTQITKPVDANIKLKNKTAFTETELKSIDTPQLQSIVQTLSDDFAKSWKAAGLDPVTVDQQVRCILKIKFILPIKTSGLFQTFWPVFAPIRHIG